MLVILSPAKTLDFETPAKTTSFSIPDFLDQSSRLIDLLKRYSPAELATLMGVSDKIAHLNCTRYESWHTPFTPENAKQALFAFRGDVYTGLQADQFSDADCEFAQQHLRILSGLYGVLKPLDLIQPYRLEMGISLPNPQGKNLYQFWDNSISDQLKADAKQGADTANVLINLASNEYFKAVKPKRLDTEIITPVFKDYKNGAYKVISFFAKKARGLMAHYIIKKRITHPEKIQRFNLGGYQFREELSDNSNWVFTREEQRAE